MTSFLRIGLMFLTLFQGIPLLWAAAFPLSFYRNFPTPDRAWLTLFPPYNEHMTHDFGFVGLSFTVVLGYTAVVIKHEVVRIALIASLVFTVPHLLYHQHHVVPGSDVQLQVASQIAPILLTLVLLAINEISNRPRRFAQRHEKAASQDS